MLTVEQRNEASRLLGTSASDCETTLMRKVEINPYTALITCGATLAHANQTNRDNKSHRQALMKAGRAALKELGGL